MAYYDAFIAGWNSVTQPPAGVTGTGLTGGMTTAQKLAALNAWTVVHPTTALVTPTQLLNSIVAADFAGLGVQGLSQLQILMTSTQVDISFGSQIRSILSTLFSGKVTTLANITVLAAPFDNATMPWWRSVGYVRQFDMGDVAAAGVV